MENLNNKIAFFIDQNLRKVGNKNFAESQKKLIGKRIVSYGVRISEVRKIARNYFRQFQEKEIDWLEIIKELIMTKVLENQMVGIFLLGHLIRTGRKITISEIEKLIKKHIDNWATCDTMCSEVITRILEKTPKEIVTLFNWRNAKNKWLRRSLLVTVVKLKNKIENWQRVALKILSSFSTEEERIVKKAIHWLEREIN